MTFRERTPEVELAEARLDYVKLLHEQAKFRIAHFRLRLSKAQNTKTRQFISECLNDAIADSRRLANEIATLNLKLDAAQNAAKIIGKETVG